jgi:small redox-active disulfide protein 2
MKIKILGSGCANCKRLEANTQQALDQLGITAEVIKVTDFKEISLYNIMRTPGFVVNERVVVSGRVPSVDEIKTLITHR